MTYTDWLTTELPKVLAGTEYFKEAEIVERGPELTICVVMKGILTIYVNPGGPVVEIRYLCFNVDQAPIIAEACQLIQTIEQKRRELK